MAKIVLYCLDVVGKAMAGPAIRYWEFAKILSKEHEVSLLVPNASIDLDSQNFKIVSYYNKSFPVDLKQADVIITQRIDYFMAFFAKMNNIRIILDAYDPLPLEGLEIFKQLPMKIRTQKNLQMVEELLLSFKMADSIICASEKQKDLWLGKLLGLSRITPEIYDQDHSIKKLIDVVPFGLSSNPPIKKGKGLRESFNLKENDKVILWGGGIWNWFDPLTLIQAIKLLSNTRSDIKLVFMGLKHPNESIKEMEMCRRAINLAKELELIDKYVFFNYGWVPYEERQNFLLDADIGISTHLDHLETRYSFRTRMLDYIWASLPIIGTTGDSFAELIHANKLGIIVPYNDPEAIVLAITKIVDDKVLSQEMKTNLSKMRERFLWENVTEPINQMIKSFDVLPKQKLTYGDTLILSKSIYKKLDNYRKEKGFFPLLSILGRKMVKYFGKSK